VFTPENIGVGAALGNLGWGAATILAKMPELALLGGGVTLSAVGVWQAIKSKLGQKNGDDT